MDVDNLIRIGTISSINPSKATARVTFEDRDNQVSKEMPIIFRRTIGTQDYSMPKVGEQVLCIFLPNGFEEGFIIGSFYVDSVPANDENKRLVKFEDGSIVEYNAGEITIDAKGGNVNIMAAKNVNIDGPDGVIIGKDVTINGNLVVKGNINATGSIIDAGGNTANHSH